MRGLELGAQFDVEPHVSAGIPEDDRRATTLITRESDGLPASELP